MGLFCYFLSLLVALTAHFLLLIFTSNVPEHVKRETKCIRKISNIISLSGEVIGQDTHDAIVEIGRKHGFHVLASGLSVMFRTLGSTFTVD